MDEHTKSVRNIQLAVWANEEEAALIRERMAAASMRNFSAFARKMLIDGYHINLDLSDVREMVVLLRRCSVNINQIAKRANETRSIYAEDMDDLRRQYDLLWDAANKILVGLAKIK
ncbi:plasmid mobilization relaxosome protein MobC [Christensenellaceae bacterium OttesenSCG-928-K19]|nr:plasmid mobilization relaxosome protein MobC [Christensenellaceae bacterium OttesenSCG-928-K19]